MLSYRVESDNGSGDLADGFRNPPSSGRVGVEPPGVAEARHKLTMLLSAEHLDPKRQHEAVTLAWTILGQCGFSTFGDVRIRRADEFVVLVPGELRDAVSLSLDTVGWLSYAPRQNQLDKAAQMFARAVTLCPLDLGRLEKFAIIAGKIRPDHIVNLAHDPLKQAQTAMGFAIQAAKHIEHVLEERFGINREVLNESSGEPLNQLLAAVSDDERHYLARVLRHLSYLHASQADFFNNGVHAGKAIAAGCSTLQIIGLPRGIAECVRMLKEALQEHHPREVLGDDVSLVASTLDSISRGFYAKWKLFNNQAAGRRSEQIDQLCDALEVALSE